MLKQACSQKLQVFRWTPFYQVSLDLLPFALHGSYGLLWPGPAPRARGLARSCRGLVDAVEIRGVDVSRERAAGALTARQRLQTHARPFALTQRGAEGGGLVGCDFAC